MIAAGILGFALMFAYDINSVTGKCRLLHFGFYVGCLLVGGTTLAACMQAWRIGAFTGIADGIFLLIALIWLAALIYCLFFALPFDKTYTAPQNGRPVYSGGAYALCRHPGVICFWGVYLFLGLAAPQTGLPVMGLLFSILNTAYAWFQDRFTFPKTFCNYDIYQRKVPFLIPNRRSIARAKRTWGCLYGKEEQL